FLKKLVIADRLAEYVEMVYRDPGYFPYYAYQQPELYMDNGLPYLIATFLFGVQIYCDFSGYTDIARGTARLMGVELMQNFRNPYFATSLRDFWKRWHISLSTWFRDYVYIPLGGNKVKKW
ncbi:MAG: hypothetical protein IH946_01485, partial [Bacteroidetes bacterium]|nr:hypothetical protein [Bacteroidota bacterium]